MAKTKKGLTLIELLLVITIILLLASIILVNFGTIKIRAQRSAVITEVSNILRVAESCNLEDRVLYCGGLVGDRTSSVNCTGDDLASGSPVSGTTVCGSSSGSSAWSDHIWPDVVRNGFMYGEYAGSEMGRGRYAFSVFRDGDFDGEPDNYESICCTHEGCSDRTELATQPGRSCRISAGLISED